MSAIFALSNRFHTEFCWAECAHFEDPLGIEVGMWVPSLELSGTLSRLKISVRARKVGRRRAV